MLIALTISIAAVIVLTMIAARTRREVRRLSERLTRADAQSLASLDVDSFGELDRIASSVYRIISDSSRQLAAEQRQRDLLQQILGGVGEGVVAIDPQRRIVLTNRRFADLFALQG